MLKNFERFQNCPKKTKFKNFERFFFWLKFKNFERFSDKNSRTFQSVSQSYKLKLSYLSVEFKVKFRKALK